jgi:hypothetical protein
VKEKDVTYRYDDHQIVYIVEKEDGTYGSVQAGSYMFETYGDDFREKLAYWARQNLEDLTSGKVSPVGFHMQRLHMTAPDVAARIGLRTSQVKKHMTVEHFGKVTIDMARRYAELFGVPLADLFQVITEPPKPYAVGHRPTANPHVVVTVCEEKPGE